MRIAVTGRNGQVARAIAERASQLGEEVSILARPEIDLLRPENVLAVLRDVRPDIVVGAAAYTSVDLAEQETGIITAVNVTGASELAKASAALNIPIVHLSTDYVFDGLAHRPYREGDTPCPVNMYGLSKLLSERAVSVANPNHAILRTSWIYSPFGKNFVRTILSLAENRADVSVVADQVGDPTSALDIAEGILTVSKNLLTNSNHDMRGIFHMTSAGGVSWAKFAKEIFRVSADLGGPSAAVIPISAAAYPTLANRPPNSRLDVSKIEKIHGVTLPFWRTSIAPVVTRILRENSVEGLASTGEHS